VKKGREEVENCICSDPGCPVNHDSQNCNKSASVYVCRIDMGDPDESMPMCEACASDALDSGVFGLYEPEDEEGEA
jgi:hypothetical protein